MECPFLSVGKSKREAELGYSVGKHTAANWLCMRNYGSTVWHLCLLQAVACCALTVDLHHQTNCVFFPGERGAKGDPGTPGVGLRGEMGPPGIPGMNKHLVTRDPGVDREAEGGFSDKEAEFAWLHGHGSGQGEQGRLP